MIGLLLLMVPSDPTPVQPTINREIPPVVVVVDTPASHEGTPISTTNGVKLTLTDGNIVTMGQHEAEVAITPPEETEAQYYRRLCLQLKEVRPYIDWNCG